MCQYCMQNTITTYKCSLLIIFVCLKLLHIEDNIFLDTFLGEWWGEKFENQEFEGI